ncbi:MAG: hypothetical protein Q4G27_05875 [Flavobacteriaceae bacterium]|nr:hypothetical protein [Flavobacteriaceae bacterium]
MVQLSSFEKKKEFNIQPFDKGKRISPEAFQSMIDEAILRLRRMNAPSYE